METRIATKKDKESLRFLWKICFNYSQNFTDWFFKDVFNPEKTVVTTQGGEIIQSFCTEEKRIKLSGKRTKALYVFAPATLPEKKSEELYKKYLLDIVAFSNDNDAVLALTIPQNYKEYEKYGFRVAYSYKQYNIAPADLLEYQIKGRILREDPGEETIKKISDIYNEFVSDKNAFVMRDEKDWSLILKDLKENFSGEIVIAEDEEKNAVGYMLFIKRDNKMGVYEIAYKNRQGYENIMGFLKKYEGVISELIIKVPENDISYLDFCDQRDAVKIKPFVSARITNVKKILEIASVNVEEDFNFRVVDRVCEENDKTFKMEKGEVIATDEEPDVITDVGTLTQIFMGYIGVLDAKKMNLVIGDEQHLTKLFEKKNNYINMLLI